MRSRWSRSDGSDRVASTRRSRSGGWPSSLSRSRSTAASVTSWKSSSTSTIGLLERLELRYEGGKEGVGAPAARRGIGGDGRVGTLECGHHLGPEDAPRVGLRTEPEPREPMPGLASSAQLDSRAVLPEPAGAAIRVSGRSMARASFSTRRGRSTIPGGMGGATSFVARTSSRSVGSAVASPSSKGVRLGSLSGSADRIKVARRFHPFRVMSDHPPPRDADRVNGTAATSKG